MTLIAPNGLAQPIFRYIHLLVPAKGGMLGTVEDWNTFVAIHEYTHILQMTNVSDQAELMCTLWEYLFPNIAVPTGRWKGYGLQ